MKLLKESRLEFGLSYQRLILPELPDCNFGCTLSRIYILYWYISESNAPIFTELVSAYEGSIKQILYFSKFLKIWQLWLNGFRLPISLFPLCITSNF